MCGLLVPPCANYIFDVQLVMLGDVCGSPDKYLLWYFVIVIRGWNSNMSCTLIFILSQRSTRNAAGQGTCAVCKLYTMLDTFRKHKFTTICWNTVKSQVQFQLSRLYFCAWPPDIDHQSTGYIGVLQKACMNSLQTIVTLVCDYEGMTFITSSSG